MNAPGQEDRKAGAQNGQLARSQQLGLLILLVVLAVYVAYDVIRALIRAH
jgi:hypothetical protein